jgi:hypothetical protein
MSKLLVEFIKEVMPFRSDDVGNTAQSEPQVSPDAAEWTKE